MKTAAVAVEKATLDFDMLYTYAVPEEFAEKTVPGVRVVAGFGRGSGTRQGIVFSVGETDDATDLKPILNVPDKEPVLNGELLELASWMAERTFCTVFDAAKAMLPTGLCLDIDGAGAKRRTGDATVKTAVLAVPDELYEEATAGLTPKQKSVADVLRDTGRAAVREICYFTGVTPSVVNSLVSKGIAELTEEEYYRTPMRREYTAERTEIVLSAEQQRAYDTFSALARSGKGAAGLLFGVTGSGKTKVYMKLLDDMLDSGRGCILMVPEISLTPQALSIFYSRYGDRVAVVHSGLSAGERLDEWKRIKNGGADLVIGTRSAVFAPVKDPGLIIIDEEQEHTYRSEMTPRYDARDVAKWRCARSDGLCLFVSATPSVETYTAAKDGRYTLAVLTERYGNAELPEVVAVDTSSRISLIDDVITEEMADALRSNLEAGNQSLLLVNRRGYNTFVACSSCKEVLTCPNCSISLTYHSANNRLLCHYCGYSRSVPDKCPECGEKTMRYSGTGTQRVEDELHRLLPDARVLRMDADTTMAKFSHEKKLGQFANGEYDILLGTQMVAKGLDFPSVTFVGVLSVDGQLYSDDYRSIERTFDLLMQVVGRAGRGDAGGTAMIQTMSPENEIIRLSAKQDYESFYNTEMSVRRLMIYPPYCDMCVIGLGCENENLLRRAAQAAFGILVDVNKNSYSDQKIIVLGPTPSRVYKISNRYRMKIIIKCRNSRRFRNMIREILLGFGRLKEFRTVSAYADINPESII